MPQTLRNTIIIWIFAKLSTDRSTESSRVLRTDMPSVPQQVCPPGCLRTLSGWGDRRSKGGDYNTTKQELIVKIASNGFSKRLLSICMWTIDNNDLYTIFILLFWLMHRIYMYFFIILNIRFSVRVYLSQRKCRLSQLVFRNRQGFFCISGLYKCTDEHKKGTQNSQLL